MLTSFKFHHIGTAVFDIEKTAPFYVDAGYHRSATIFDPLQNVNICWLTKKGMPTVELLEPAGEQSPVMKTLQKNGVSPYHTCYIVDNIEQAVNDLRKQKYVAMGRPVEAVAFCKSRVVFLFNKHVGIIELVESPANIID